MKKKKKIRYKRRLIVYTSLALFIILSVIDYHLETVGLPDKLTASLKEKLLEKGLDIAFDDAKIGIVNGLVLENPILCGLQQGGFTFTAKKLKIGFSFSPFEKFGFSINSLDVTSGRFKVHLFPEAGEEGINDLLDIEEVNASINISNTQIDMEHFSGILEPFRFSAAGSLKNILIPGGSGYSGSFKSSSGKISIVPFIEKLPYVSRCTVYREILKFRDGGFTNKRPECHVVFSLDSSDPESSFFKADIKSPKLTYGVFNIQSVDAKISLKNYRIELSSLEIRLPEGGNVKMSGMIDLARQSATGKADIKVLPGELSGMVRGENLQFPEFIKLKNKPMTLKASVEDFSLNSLSFEGFINLNVPEAEIQNIPVYNLKSDLFINESMVSATGFSLETEKNSIIGNFDYYPQSENLDAHFKVNGNPDLCKKFFDDQNNMFCTYVLDRFKFNENRKDVELIFDLRAVLSKDPFWFLSAKIAVNDFKFSDVYFTNGSAQVFYDSNFLVLIPGMILKQENTLSTVSIVYDNSEDIKYDVKSDFFSNSSVQKDRFLAEIDGNTPGLDVLKCLFPEWKSNFLDLSSPSTIKAHGAVDFLDMSKTLFFANIIESPCRWNEIPVDSLNCDIVFKGTDMEIVNAVGKVYNGDFMLNYLYNLDTWKGKLDVSVANADFAPIAKYIGGDLKDREKGRLSFTVKSDISFDKDDKLFMDGKGKLWIRDADLWDIPIINEFGELTQKWIGRDWGNISSLDADMDFRNDHIFSKNIHTDGTVVSLDAQGDYYWNNNNFDYTIKARVLPSALPFKIPEILRPIAWLLESRVYRKNDEVKWEKISSVKRLFK